MSNTCSVLWLTTPTIFSMSFCIFSKQTALSPFTILPYMMFLNMPVSHRRNSSGLLSREMRNAMHNSSNGWQHMHPNSLGFSMRFLRTRGPQHVVMDDRGKGG